MSRSNGPSWVASSVQSRKLTSVEKKHFLLHVVHFFTSMCWWFTTGRAATLLRRHAPPPTSRVLSMASAQSAEAQDALDALPFVQYYVVRASLCYEIALRPTKSSPAATGPDSGKACSRSRSWTRSKPRYRRRYPCVFASTRTHRPLQRTRERAVHALVAVTT